MAYRSRLIEVVKYGNLPEYLAVIDAMNNRAQATGRIPATVLTPVAGLSNQVITETEFEDMTAYQAQVDSFWSDDEAIQLWRSKAAITMEGQSHSELLFVVT
ncbi:MAG: hypothetical protein ACRDZ8_11260 [Acidimicrobiales bacterium]